jgi:hypothetical protein
MGKGTAKVHWDNDKYSVRATVYPFGDETHEQRFVSIDITRHEKMGGNGFEEAKVNWPSIGAQDAKTARLFGEGLVKAAEVCEEMNWPVKRFQVTYTIRRDGEVNTHTETWVGTHYKQIEQRHVPEDVTIDKVEEVQ